VLDYRFRQFIASALVAHLFVTSAARGQSFPHFDNPSTPVRAATPSDWRALPPVTDSIGLDSDDLAPLALPAPPMAELGPAGTDVPQCTRDEERGGLLARLTRYGAPNDLPPICDDCPNHGLVAFLSYDSFRGVSDGGWQNNGVVAGLNFGTRLGVLSDMTGIGFQIGASVGAFNWDGTDYRTSDQNSAQTQGFFTYGFFRRPDANSRITFAVVQDEMYNNNFGEFAQSPNLGQMRGQLGYALSAWNELGIWGSWRGWGDTLFVQGFGPTTYRPIDQLNVYWHHKWFFGGPDTWIWVGRPEQDRLTRDGSLGEYIANASATAPLGDRVGLFTQATYMHPSAAPGPAGSAESAWNFTIGLAFYPRRSARSATVAGRCWMPLLPVANNGTFFVDTNRTF
jgi:hypothetical protein